MKKSIYVGGFQHEVYKNETIDSWKIGKKFIVYINKYIGKPEMILFSKKGKVLESVNPLVKSLNILNRQ